MLCLEQEHAAFLLQHRHSQCETTACPKGRPPLLAHYHPRVCSASPVCTDKAFGDTSMFSDSTGTRRSLALLPALSHPSRRPCWPRWTWVIPPACFPWGKLTPPYFSADFNLVISKSICAFSARIFIFLRSALDNYLC